MTRAEQMGFFAPAPDPNRPPTLRELPVSEHPTYRLEHYGVGALSQA